MEEWREMDDCSREQADLSLRDGAWGQGDSREGVHGALNRVTADPWHLCSEPAPSDGPSVPAPPVCHCAPGGVGGAQVSLTALFRLTPARL